MSKRKLPQILVAERPSAPRAARKPEALRAHGDTRIDPYYWLRGRDNPAVMDYLEQENEYTRRVLASGDALKARLIAEMRARMPEDERSAPYKDGDYYYFQRFESGAEYPLYCRSAEGPAGREQLLLNVNELAAGHDYFSLCNFSVSPNHRLAAFAVDTEGRRFYTLYFVDLVSGRLLDDEIQVVTSDFEWANDSETIVYVRQDRQTLRHSEVWRHRLGDDADERVFAEADDTFWVGLERSLSQRFIFIVSAATLTTEVSFLPADQPMAQATLFMQRQTGHEYYVTDGEDRFFVLSNDAEAVNFRVLETPLSDTRRSAWQEWLAHRDDVLIDSIEVFDTHVVLSTVAAGNDRIEIAWRDGRDRQILRFDEAAHSVSPEDNYEYRTSILRFGYESLTTPPSVIDMDLVSGERRLVKSDAVLGGFRKDDYQSERIWVTVRDATEVPVSLVYRRGLTKDGNSPLLLEAYGAYGLSSDPEFDTDLLSLLDRGFVYAIAHVRGGSEMGRQWYEAGRRGDKRNSFNDFVDVTEHLIDAGYTAASRCYAIGGSAGGLLIGAIANMAPQLYNGLVTRVPFVDVVTTMLDESIPLTTGEFDEWGNPADVADYKTMLEYSPYDNVRPQAYPHMLVTAGLHDSQVQYWEPAKWVARLRELRSDDGLLLFDVDTEAGHSGKTGRFRSLEDTALVYTFLLLLEGIAD